MYSVATFYKFVALTNERLQSLKSQIIDHATELGIKGLLLLGGEGCNATIAGEDNAINKFKECLCSIPEFQGLEFKDSRSAKIPFRRFKVDIRCEIVTLKDESVDAEKNSANHLDPASWNEELSAETKPVIIDTRNFYETELGMFEGAIDLKLAKFSEFSQAIEKLNLDHDSKILMYCTGGIRCEKAMVSMKNAGFDNVFQLKGGILKYLEEYPNSKFKGECFVFDHRVAVDQALQPSSVYELCPHCGNPASKSVKCLNCDKQRKVCDHCIELTNRNSCSKNCAHHIQLRARRREASAA